MFVPIELQCIVCSLSFCCSDCRWKHEQCSHKLTYNCYICRGLNFFCQPDKLNKEFLEHLKLKHLPLYCKKCNQLFSTMEDLQCIDKCTSLSELVDRTNDYSNTIELEEKFDSIYEKIAFKREHFETIVRSNKTAVVSPMIRKMAIVDYECDTESENEYEENLEMAPKILEQTNNNTKFIPKTPKTQRMRIATPHVRKFLGLMRQNVVEDQDDAGDEMPYSKTPVAIKTTPSRDEQEAVASLQRQMTTPISHIPHVVKLSQAVTTSTPTHALMGGWPMFSESGVESPLSEIENNESPGQSIDKEQSSIVPAKLKSIIVIGNKNKNGSHDSSHKTTFQDSANSMGSLIKTKKVKFAENTVFEQENKTKRVYRKPKRMLTPGPQKPKRFCFNPRFQALINRFEQQTVTSARTPVNRDKQQEPQEHNLPPRAINFKDESPKTDIENVTSDESAFKTCFDYSETSVNNAVTAFTANVAGSLQSCLDSVFKTTEENTEIQFKFVITKKKVSVRRIDSDENGVNEIIDDIDRSTEKNVGKIWSSVAKAVKTVFWGTNKDSTTSKSIDNISNDTSSNISKRKFIDISEPNMSPLNHKRHRFEGRIKGRPPLRNFNCGQNVPNPKISRSVEQQNLTKNIETKEEFLNLSY